MIRKNKGTLIASSLVTLLPIAVGLLLWDRLPPVMTTHFGGDGVADGFSTRGQAIFILPLIMLALHWVCILATLLDKKNIQDNPKIFRLVVWIIPALSCSCMGFMYFVALGYTFSALRLMMLVMGLMFAAIGNLMPKVTQNRTMGIKIFWTLSNEENWYATHRFAGKVWFFGGLGMLLCILLPDRIAMIAFLCCLLPLALLPVAYSWRFYRKQVQSGTVPEKQARSPQYKRSAGASAIISLVTVAFVSVFLFSGSIRFEAGEQSLQITASFSEDLTVDYSSVDSMEYREDGVPGSRTIGFGSPKLSKGTFSNEEFGLYTRYTYTQCPSAIVIRSGDQILVISAEDAAATEALYEALLTKLG